MLIGITQRVYDDPSRNERLDTLDQAWFPFLARCGFEVLVIPNSHPDPGSYAKKLGVQGLILSGGNNISAAMKTIDGGDAQPLLLQDDLAPERDRVESTLLTASLSEEWPVVGVCRGMQALNVYHGGRLRRVEGHVRRDHSVRFVDAWPQDGEMQVNSYHGVGMHREDLAEGIRPLGFAGDDSVEAFCHQQHSHWGIMWHPERYRKPRAADVAFFETVVRGQSAN